MKDLDSLSLLKTHYEKFVVEQVTLLLAWVYVHAHDGILYMGSTLSETQEIF